MTISSLFSELVGGFASFASIVLNLSPITTVLQFRTAKSTGKHPLLPYSGMMLSGLVWGVYGLMARQPEVTTTFVFS